jgi:SAM-dependent methyltransferase
MIAAILLNEDTMNSSRDLNNLDAVATVPSLDKLYRHPALEELRQGELAKYDQVYFNEHYWREDLPGCTGNHGLSYDDPDHSLRFSFLFESLIANEKAKRVLDVGCGPGLLLSQASTHGIDAWGVDCSPVARNLYYERENVKLWDHFLVASATSLPFPSSSFDLCLCLDVLEHLPVLDGLHAIYEMCRVCSDHLICSINVDNPYAYHPTILSREQWVSLFEATDMVGYDADGSIVLNRQIKARYPEYDFFCFNRK